MCKHLLIKKVFLLLIWTAGFVSFAGAQKGANAVKVLAEVGFPLQDFNPGAGGQVKFLYGVGRAGQLGLTAGFTKFTDREPVVGGDFEPTRLTTIPVMVGYRHHIGGFYLEPQVGYGALNGRIDIGGDWSRPSVGAFYWSAGAGYELGRLDIGVRYQSAYGAEGPSAGTWHDKDFHFIGVHAGFTLWQR